MSLPPPPARTGPKLFAQVGTMQMGGAHVLTTHRVPSEGLGPNNNNVNQNIGGGYEDLYYAGGAQQQQNQYDSAPAYSPGAYEGYQQLSAASSGNSTGGGIPHTSSGGGGASPNNYIVVPTQAVSAQNSSLMPAQMTHSGGGGYAGKQQQDQQQAAAPSSSFLVTNSAADLNAAANTALAFQQQQQNLQLYQQLQMNQMQLMQQQAQLAMYGGGGGMGAAMGMGMPMMPGLSTGLGGAANPSALLGMAGAHGLLHHPSAANAPLGFGGGGFNPHTALGGGVGASQPHNNHHTNNQHQQQQQQHHQFPHANTSNGTNNNNMNHNAMNTNSNTNSASPPSHDSVCKDFLVGRCVRQQCRFIHLPPNVRPFPDDVCKDFIRGTCNRPVCRFFHGTVADYQGLRMMQQQGGGVVSAPPTSASSVPSPSGGFGTSSMDMGGGGGSTLSYNVSTNAPNQQQQPFPPIAGSAAVSGVPSDPQQQQQQQQTFPTNLAPLENQTSVASAASGQTYSASAGAETLPGVGASSGGGTGGGEGGSGAGIMAHMAISPFASEGNADHPVTATASSGQDTTGSSQITAELPLGTVVRHEEGGVLGAPPSEGGNLLAGCVSAVPAPSDTRSTVAALGSTSVGEGVIALPAVAEMCIQAGDPLMVEASTQTTPRLHGRASLWSTTKATHEVATEPMPTESEDCIDFGAADAEEQNNSNNSENALVSE